MSEIEPGGRDTVTIDEAVHYVYRQLTEGNDLLDVPFRTMKDVFMWAASIGFERGKRRPLSGKRTTIFRFAQFSAQVDIPLLKALAVADGEVVDVVADQEQLITIAEEYANGGIIELRNIMFEGYSQPLWRLVEHLKA